jgi:hypothetical protein
LREKYLSSTQAAEVRDNVETLSAMLTRLRLRLADSSGAPLDP